RLRLAPFRRAAAARLPFLAPRREPLPEPAHQRPLQHDPLRHGNGLQSLANGRAALPRSPAERLRYRAGDHSEGLPAEAENLRAADRLLRADVCGRQEDHLARRLQSNLRPAPRSPLRLMLNGKRVAVVVPACDEEELLPVTLAGVPGFVDRIYVVDDASRDASAARARDAAAADPRIIVVEHERNRGVGAAIITGYKRAVEERIDVTCVMAADNQMDPVDLQGLVELVSRGEVDYAKTNRLFS